MQEPSPLARGLAFLAYVLLLLGCLTLGTSAVVGVVIAYAGRDGALPLIRSHFQFQIHIFWVTLALLVMSAALVMSAFIDAARAPPRLRIPISPHAQLIAYRPDLPARPEPAQFVYHFRFGDLNWTPRARFKSSAAGLFLACAALWGFAAPVWGMARLASGLAIGHRRP